MISFLTVFTVSVIGGCLNRVAGIAMSDVQRATAGASTSTAKAARSGGVLFVHRFGSTLNAHVHLHLCMLDGVVALGRQGLGFCGARVHEACVERVQALVRQRVLGLFEGRGLLSRETVAVMQGWGHSGGFSVHAGVRVAGQDSAGREQLLRYCARSMFAGAHCGRGGDIYRGRALTVAGHIRARPPAAVSGLRGKRRRVLLLRASNLCEH